MEKPWTVWLTNEILSKILESEQREIANQILPMRQAVIGEETITIDEEHEKGHNGGCGLEGIKGMI